MAKKDYYESLGLPKTASQEDIKKAYRRLAMKHHPDRNPDDKDSEAKFKEIKEAYEILSDEKKRASYDQFGHAGVQGGPGAGAAGAGGFGGFDFGDIGDIFGDIFGGRRARQGPQRGSDLVYTLDLNLEQAVHGTTVKIKVPTWVECTTCHGSGAKPGTHPVSCPSCDGSGHVRLQQGFFTVEQTCPECRGSGRKIEHKCPKCYGQGRQQETKTLSVKVPAGVDNGDQIRLANEGEAGEQGASPGDLYVRIRVAPHEIFKREGDDLYCEVPISIFTAILGGELEVPTMDGKVRLKIPAGTQSGKSFRLRSKGIQSARSHHRGDLFCHVMVETPVHLSKEQQTKIKELAEDIDKKSDQHNPQAKTWFESVKKFFAKT